jgi:hypothetical protein
MATSPGEVVKSAVEAESAARDFVASRFPYAVVQVHKVSYRREDGLWVVRGSYRLPHWSYPRPFLVEVGADNGTIMGFEF